MITDHRFDVPTRGERQTHTWVVVDDLVICLTQAGPIPDEQWARFARDVASPNVKAVLGLSFESVSVNSVQRKAVSAAIKGKTLAAVLESTVTRGVLTALGWLGLNIKVFPWRQLDAAIEQTAPSKATAAIAKQLIEELLRRSNAPSLVSLMEGTGTANSK